MQKILCSLCNEPVSAEQAAESSCWCSCPACNILFPRPFFQPDSVDAEVRLPLPLTLEPIRSKESLEFRYAPTGLLASLSERRFLFWKWAIRVVVFAWMIVWAIVCYENVSPGKTISDPVGFFLAISLLAGFFWFLCISWLVWSRTSMIFDRKGMTRWTKGLFFSYRDLFLPREKFITLTFQVYEDRDKKADTEYAIHLCYHPNLKRQPLGGEVSLLRGSIWDRITDRRVVESVAAQLLEFLKSLPPLESGNPSDGVFDRQLRGETPCFDLYCPICRTRHQIKEKEFVQEYGRFWFYCSHCHAAVELEKTLFRAGTEPPRSEPNRNRPRNGIVLPGEGKYDKESLLIHTKSHLGMLGLWSIPYLLGIVLFWAIILVVPFGFMIYLSVASGYYEPMYRFIPLELILCFFVPIIALPKYLRYELCVWDTRVNRDGIRYSFGIWDKTIRQWKDLSQLRFERRNRSYFRYDEPSNPAEEFPHGVLIFLDDWIWAEIPCRDEQEVDRVFEVLTSFRRQWTQETP